jgi:hypothetical protein
MVVFAGVVSPVGFAGSALGRDEGAVDEDHLFALLGDLPQGTVQTRCLVGEQSDELVPPAADGGLGHVVAASHVGQALIVPQFGQDDHRDPPRGRIRHRDRIAFRWRLSRSARWLTVRVDSARRH